MIFEDFFKDFFKDFFEDLLKISGIFLMSALIQACSTTIQPARLPMLPNDFFEDTFKDFWGFIEDFLEDF